MFQTHITLHISHTCDFQILLSIFQVTSCRSSFTAAPRSCQLGSGSEERVHWVCNSSMLLVSLKPGRKRQMRLCILYVYTCDQIIDRQIDSQIARQLDSQIARQLDSQIARQLDSQIAGQLDSQIARQLDRQIDRQVDRSIGRQVDRSIDRQIDRSIDGQMDRSIDRQIGRQVDR